MARNPMPANSTVPMRSYPPTSGRLLSLPADVLLLGMISDPGCIDQGDPTCPLVHACRLPQAERFQWIRSLPPETKNTLVSRYLTGMV